MTRTEKLAYLRLKFSQMKQADRYADNNKILTGLSLQNARRKILQEMVSLRGVPARQADSLSSLRGRIDRNAMVWSNTANLFNMRRRISGTNLEEVLRDTIIQQVRSPEGRLQAVSRCICKHFPHLMSEDAVRIGTLQPRNIEAIRRRMAARPMSLGQEYENYRAGAPVVMDRSGHYRIIDDSMGIRIPAAHVSRKAPRALTTLSEEAGMEI